MVMPGCWVTRRATSSARELEREPLGARVLDVLLAAVALVGLDADVAAVAADFDELARRRAGFMERDACGSASGAAMGLGDDALVRPRRSISWRSSSYSATSGLSSSSRANACCWAL